jgi:predicted NUDIX family NTP pyrophosphohydrolase
MYRRRPAGLEVLLVHLGGPYWRRKQKGFWTIPKGELEAGEEPLAAARREFAEETGLEPREPFVELGSIRQKGGKIVHAWGFEGDCDPARIESDTFVLEWPPRSGKKQRFPEIDEARFFTVAEAREWILPAQAPLVEELARRVDSYSQRRK